MSDFSVQIVEPGSILAQRALSLVEDRAQLSWIILFGGGRWACVEHVGVALSLAGSLVGLATLSPTDEMGSRTPHVIGVWVIPERRKQGVGMGLVQALAAKSLEVYGNPPMIQAVTFDGSRLLARLLREGVPVVGQQIDPPFNWPDTDEN